MRALRWLWRLLRRFRLVKGGSSPSHTRRIHHTSQFGKLQIRCPDCEMKLWCEARLNRVTRYWYTDFYCPNCQHWCSASIRVPIHEFV